MTETESAFNEWLERFKQEHGEVFAFLQELQHPRLPGQVFP
jgi:hypothetical protein